MSYGLLMLVGEMTLRELRHRRALSQQDVAESMNIAQSGISKIERRKTDARIARIRRYLEAMDIKLHLVAELPDGECFEISQFAQIEAAADPGLAQEAEPEGRHRINRAQSELAQP